MTRARFLLIAILAFVGFAVAQPTGPRIELKGKVEKLRISRGQGMPSMDVKTADRTVSVQLGSMRYLMEQQFNPKAGDEVAVTGYKATDGVIAISVTMTATGRVLKLRSEDGRPVWMGGRRR